MKVAPVLHALKKRQNVVQILIHAGQHYDVKMSNVFNFTRRPENLSRHDKYQCL